MKSSLPLCYLAAADNITWTTCYKSLCTLAHTHTHTHLHTLLSPHFWYWGRKTVWVQDQASLDLRNLVSEKQQAICSLMLITLTKAQLLTKEREETRPPGKTNNSVRMTAGSHPGMTPDTCLVHLQSRVWKQSWECSQPVRDKHASKTPAEPSGATETVDPRSVEYLQESQDGEGKAADACLVPARGGARLPGSDVTQLWQLVRPPCRNDRTEIMVTGRTTLRPVMLS